MPDDLFAVSKSIDGVDTGRVTGATAADYTSPLTWDCARLGNKTIHLFNTHATASLYYKLLGRYYEGQTVGKEDVLVAETALTAGQDARLQYDRQYDRLILQVKTNSAACTFEINYSGRRT